MNTSGVMHARRPKPADAAGHRSTLKRLLLQCGILSSLLYIAMNVVVALMYDGYSSLSQTVSELSAIDAPTRGTWVPLGVVYSLLTASFGCGIWLVFRSDQPLRTAGALIFANGIISTYWPPMHMRGVEASLTDTLHIVYSGVTVLLMLSTILFAAKALGKQFRIYSIATIGILVVFGALTGLSGPRIAANLPTPLIGLWERISIGAYMLWVIVFAITLLKRHDLKTWHGSVFPTVRTRG